MKARATSPLSEISLIAVATASGLRSHGYGGGKSAIAGRRSQTTTSRGASSAKRSRTMNSSTPRASESLADAAQSIAATSSPGTYGRDPATSDPRPRRTLRMPPNERPTIRRRWTSGNVRRDDGKLFLRGRGERLGLELLARTRRHLEALDAELLCRRLPSGRACLCDEARREHDPVEEHRDEEPLDVAGRDVRPPRQERPRAGRALEREAAAHRRADRHRLDVARRPDEPDDPALHDLVDVDGLDGLAQLVDLGQRHGRLEQRNRMRAKLLAHDLQLVVLGRVAERGLEEEAVELRLGEREGSLLLDRVLRREQQERRGQGPGDAVDGDLVLGHRLEQGRRGLRHRADDLVDQHDVGEDRPGAELEVALPLVENREARHVGRLQVRRALDTRWDRAL